MHFDTRCENFYEKFHIQFINGSVNFRKNLEIIFKAEYELAYKKEEKRREEKKTAVAFNKFIHAFQAAY